MKTSRRQRFSAAAFLPVAVALLHGQAPHVPTPAPAVTLEKPVTPLKAVGPDGFIRRWLVLEPIHAPGLTESAVREEIRKNQLPDQSTDLPQDGDKAAIDGEELIWHAVDTRKYNLNLFHFARALGKPTSDVLFWVTTMVTVPQAMHNVRLAIGSNAASVWWVNGQEVIGIYGDRQTVIDDGISRRLDLHKGPNLLRAAVVNGGGATDFCARFLDAQDKPITGITASIVRAER